MSCARAFGAAASKAICHAAATDIEIATRLIRASRVPAQYRPRARKQCPIDHSFSLDETLGEGTYLLGIRVNHGLPCIAFLEKLLAELWLPVTPRQGLGSPRPRWRHGGRRRTSDRSN